MNTFTKLKLHLERHMYKRGRNKGEAPADSSRRSKSGFRVLAQGNTMVVRMYGTDIITAYEDGIFLLNTGGWWTNTTRANLNDALNWFVPRTFIRVSGRLVFGMRQPTVTSNQKTMYFYDGITFDAEGTLIGEPRCFERKRVDKAETAEFREDIAKSGFKDAFPILYQAAEVPEVTWVRHPLHKTMRDECHANDWPFVVALVKYPSYGNRLYNKPAHADWRNAWKTLMANATKSMTEVIRTDVTYLP